MAFSFVHTADWQLGKSFGRLPEDRTALLREARLEVVDTLARLAQQTSGHVLVAGDVFDGETVPATLVRTAMARMAAHPRLTWHLISGNHDPARAGGLWAIAQREGVPVNVRLHLEPGVSEIAPGVDLLAAPLRSKSTGSDPTQWMDQAATGEGRLRLGLAHGSTRGFTGEGEAAVPIAEDRAARARLDYLALGDWHGTVEIDARTWYSGTPESDRHRNNQSGQALVVSIAGRGAPPNVRVERTGAHVWRNRKISIRSDADLDAIERELHDLGPEARKLLLDLQLEGRVSLAVRAGIEPRIERWRSRLFHLDADLSGLRLSLDEGAWQTAIPAGPVRVAAERLAAVARAEGADSRVAATALARLQDFAADDAGQS